MTISRITTRNVTPYWDDWSEDKNFNQILFRPARGVQVRELNQMQTILQSQLDYLGQYTFDDGSVVIGGDINTFSRDYVNTTSTSGQTTATTYIEGTATGGTNGVTATVQDAYINSDTSNKITLFVSYTNSGTANTTSVFADGEAIALTSPSASLTVSSTGSPTGKGSFASIGEGVYFYGGRFIYAPAQTILLDYFAIEPSYEVGFSLVETEVTSADAGYGYLTDNAVGTPNVSAPGADRLRITATIVKRPLDPVTGEYSSSEVEADIPDNYIPHTKIIKGVVTKKPALDNFDTPASDIIEQRTYEESGDYTLGQFEVGVREAKEVIVDGVSNLGESTSGDIDQFVIDLEPSVAYIKGRRIEMAKQEAAITVDKPRDISGTYKADKTYGEKFITTTAGQYLLASANNGVPKNLYSDQSTTATSGKVRLFDAADQNTQIGTCCIKQIEKDSASSKYRLYVFNVKMSSNTKIGDVLGITIYDAATSGDIEGSWSILAADAGLKDAEQNESIYRLPVQNVKSLKNSSNVDDSDFIIRTVLESSTGTSGVFTFTAPAGYGLATTVLTDHWIQPGDVSDTPDYGPLTDTTAIAGSVGDTSFTLAQTTDTGATIARASVLLKALTVVRNKTKTHEYNFKDTLSYATATGSYSLAKTDGLKLLLVYETSATNVTQSAAAGVTDSLTFTVGSNTGIVVGQLVSGGSISKPTYVTNINSTTITVDKAVTAANNDTITFETIIDHTAKFEFDGGQRAASYERATLVRKPSTTPADITVGTNNLFVRYNYYSHSSAGTYFSVDSYPSADYNSIPVYGEFELRDCLDFRVNDPINSSTPHYYPAIGEGITLKQPTIWLGRKDTLHLNNKGEYIYRKGIPSINPAPPTSEPIDSIHLYDVECKPYVYRTETDINFTSFDNVGFTMSDIRNMNVNIDQLQYYTALNQLNSNDRSALINSRGENGFLLDNFSSPRDGIGDILHPDYNCAMVNGDTLVPPFTQTSVNLLRDTTNTSTALIWSGGVASLTKTDVIEVSQPHRSYGWEVHLNPNGISNYRSGTVEFSPASDVWMSENSMPDPINNEWQRYTANGVNNRISRNYRWSRHFGSIGANEWAQSAGVESFVNAARSTYRVNKSTGQVQIGKDGKWTNIIKVRPGARQYFLPVTANSSEVNHYAHLNKLGLGRGFRRLREFSGIRITPSYTGFGGTRPQMRSREVYFKVSGVRPNTRLYAFTGHHSLQNHVKSCTAAEYAANIFGNKTDAATGLFTYEGALEISGGPSAITSDSAGNAYGILLIPNNNLVRLNSGEAKIIFSSSPTNTWDDRATSAVGSIYSGENINELQQTTQDVSSAKFDRSHSTEALSDFENWNDGALAQVFTTSEEGCMASKAAVYVTYDIGEAPLRGKLVTCDVNGLPTRNVLAGARGSKTPLEIADPGEGGVGLCEFEFSNPVLLEGNTKYALVLNCNSSGFKLASAYASSKQSGSSKNSYKGAKVGTMYKASNDSNWNPQSNHVLKFEIYRCKFDVADKDLYLVNDAAPTRLLPNNPLEVISTSTSPNLAVVRVYHPAHGMYGSSPTHDVTLSGIPTNGFNNMTQAQLQTKSTVSNATSDHYEISITWSGTQPVEHLIGGGEFLSATGNVVYNMIQPALDMVEPNGTDTIVAVTGTTGVPDDAEASAFVYNRATEEAMNNNAFNIIDAPYVVLSADNQGINSLSGRSLGVLATLSTVNERFSPLVNINASHVITHSHIINNPTGYPADTSAYGGQSIAQFVSSKIELNQTSNNLDIFVDIARPEGSDVELYYKTSSEQDENFADLWDDLDWVKIVNQPVPGDDEQMKIEPSSIPFSADTFNITDNSDTHNEIHYSVEPKSAGGNPFSFNAVAIKIVFKSNNSSAIPSCKNLRVIASK